MGPLGTADSVDWWSNSDSRAFRAGNSRAGDRDLTSRRTEEGGEAGPSADEKLTMKAEENNSLKGYTVVMPSLTL